MTLPLVLVMIILQDLRVMKPRKCVTNCLEEIREGLHTFYKYVKESDAVLNSYFKEMLPQHEVELLPFPEALLAISRAPPPTPTDTPQAMPPPAPSRASSSRPMMRLVAMM
ncbi:hypothetical protein V6N13_110624 [Hibiscus sabdariffa]